MKYTNDLKIDEMTNVDRLTIYIFFEKKNYIIQS